MSRKALNMPATSGGKIESLVKTITAVINIPACGFFLYYLSMFLTNAPVDFSLLNATVGTIFLGSIVLHMMLGMKTVIIDYVRHPAWLMILRVGNILFCVTVLAMGIVGMFVLYGS